MQVMSMHATEAAASGVSRLKPLKQPLDPAVCRKAERYAVRVCAEMSKRSTILKEQETVALFDSDEILPYLGELLGKGGFNNVYELEKIELVKECPSTEIQRKHIVNTKPKLAIKFLADRVLLSSKDACNGSADLLMEAKYLTALAAHPHPALIRLHGISAAGPAGFGMPERAGFFLIIDRLYDTLDQRIVVWKEMQHRKTAQLQNEETHKYLTVLFLQRLVVALNICSALVHLHSLGIMFRDLKPDNVGFDFEGKVKIFDFGLAKELDPKQRDKSGLYHMSGGTGSRRFMAPEVALSEPYGLSADIYSFGILLWEIIALKKAYGRMDVDQHRKLVVQGEERPEMDQTWSSCLQGILKGCWDRYPIQRPEAKDVHSMLRKEMNEMLIRNFPIHPTSDD